MNCAKYCSMRDGDSRPLYVHLACHVDLSLSFEKHRQGGALRIWAGAAGGFEIQG
jgi:hypothetical protein